ncbi:ABC transporter domain-containing protein [Plasmodiophora brassicae]
MSVSMQRGVVSSAPYARLPDKDEEAVNGRAAPPPRTKMQLMGRAWRSVWPVGAVGIRVRFGVSVLLLLTGKVLDLAPPFALKLVVDNLTAPAGPKFPLVGLLLFGISRFLSACVGELRNIVYATVSANAERIVALDVLEHLLNLSFRYHISRKTGSVLRSVSRGASSFSDVIRIFLFQFCPVILQVVLVCTLLLVRFDWWFALITFLSITLYVVYTIFTTGWRDKHRRHLADKDNAFNQRAVDCLLNYETVKYFNAEEHEKRRYDIALREYRDASILSQQSLSVLNMGQNFIISIGVTSAMFLAADQVSRGEQSVGDFMMIQQFILTLYTPLGFLGTYWRMINQALVDVESMLNILEENVEVKDIPLAPSLHVDKAHIEFRNVSFSYKPGQPLLKGISFEVKPGQTVALVGASGAGKSTIGRLLYRFFDVTDGQILIDGQNIAHVSQQSLRRSIGIVPQDCVLFNDSFAYNIGYGIKSRQLTDASMDDIVAAAKAASIHDFIMSQPDGYETKCGERGLRLSGGERQRIAIARAILKNPAIMLYDEATSSLDTITEQAIQSSLTEIAKGRSVLCVAHRLSTVVNSSRIIVLKDGEIAESGTHNELLARNGIYADMWRRQQNQAQLEGSLADLDRPLRS